MNNWSQPSGGQSRYRLEINNSAVIADVLQFHGREALSEPFCWEIEFTTSQLNIAPDQILMKYASLHMGSDRQVHGIITRLASIATSADQSHYCVTLSSRLALLSFSRQSALYQHQSVPEVVEQVLRCHGLEGADFIFRLERHYPQRALITQWRETDLQFIRRLLAETGIFWRTEMDSARGQDVVIFADSQLGYQFAVCLPYTPPSGLYDGTKAAVWDVRTRHITVTDHISLRDYNYRTAAATLDASVSVRSTAVTTGEHYGYAPPCLETGDETDPQPETESGAFYARLHHERELNKAEHIHLFSNAPQLSPGQVLELQGNSLSALKEGVVITLTTFRASRDQRLHVSVQGMPYSERYSFRPPYIPRPRISGTLPARIESQQQNDTVAWLDDSGRYRVRLDIDRSATERGQACLWLRQAKPYAGDTSGWHTPLTDGTEVAIAFHNGDPERPYIAHALHNDRHPDLVNRDNHSRNVLRTPANNKLRMEDRRGAEHIKLTTEYGKTQLNSGHLVDAQDKQRGTGTELRTDEWGVIRAGKGLLISADPQAKAQGEALNREAALQEISRLQQQLQQLNMAAEQAQALKADADSQIRLFEQRLKPLRQAVLFSAPEGVALTSGEHMQLAASENIAIGAGGNISAGTMGNITTQAGDKLGLFARTGQLSLKSAEGPVTVEAQNGRMQLFAQQKLRITTADEMLFAGKKSITLTGGGSYLKLTPGQIEYGTTGTYLRKVPMTTKGTSAMLPLHLPLMPLADRFVPQAMNKKLKPVLRIADAPGVNGLGQPGRQWQIVEANNSMQAITTDQVLMEGESDATGHVLQTAAQQDQLIQLALQYQNCLWLVIGHRAHRLSFNTVPASASENTRVHCELDAMGFHQQFNRLSGNGQPTEELKQRIQAEQAAGGQPIRGQK